MARQATYKHQNPRGRQSPPRARTRNSKPSNWQAMRAKFHAARYSLEQVYVFVNNTSFIAYKAQPMWLGYSAVDVLHFDTWQQVEEAQV